MAAPQKLLTIDCGNSTIHCRRDDGRIWSTCSKQPDFATLASFVGEVPTRAVAVSVVPAAFTRMREALAGMNVAVAVVGDQLPCPLQLAYETVETLGADRWLGAYAAYSQFGESIVIDCGTATTVNVVDGEGTFRGGAIGPGLAAFLAGLAAKAPALPSANLDAEPVLPAASTQECVDAGVLLGWAGLVERLLTHALRTCTADVKVVVTGGNAPRLLRLSEWLSDTSVCQYAPELLHDGLRALDMAARSS